MPPPARHDIIPQPVVTSTVPSIIIIGEKPDTNPPPPTNPPPVVVAPAVPAPVPLTNTPALPPTNPPAPKAAAPTVTNLPAATVRENSGNGDSNFLAIAAGLLGAAVVLGIIVRLRLHRKDSSLITRSMNDRR